MVLGLDGMTDEQVKAYNELNDAYGDLCSEMSVLQAQLCQLEELSSVRHQGRTVPDGVYAQFFDYCVEKASKVAKYAGHVGLVASCLSESYKEKVAAAEEAEECSR